MIIELLTAEIRQFLEEIENLGFSLCLVGGISRDYFYTGKLGQDIDCEIRSTQKLENPETSWPVYYKKLHLFLTQKKLEYIELPYLITRVRYGGMNFEFSSPRIEINLPDNFTHHHFKASLSPDLSYAASFKRRDFTINAIGIELKLNPPCVEAIIDPFMGLDDLKKGILKNITEDFFLDSVRFLRLIRFKLKFNKFNIESNLLNKLDQFNLTQISVHHFIEELFKSQPGPFLNYFSQLVVTKQLLIPESFRFWTKYTFPETIASKEELMAYVYFQNEKDAPQVSSFFSLPEKKLKDLMSFTRSFEAVRQLTKQDFVKILAMPIQDALKLEIFKDLKNLEEKKEWRFSINFNKASELPLVGWSDWSKISVSEDELNLIDPPQRSYYKYFKTIKKIF